MITVQYQCSLENNILKMDFGIHGNTPTIPSGTFLKLKIFWLIRIRRLDDLIGWSVKIWKPWKNMKSKSKIISRNSFKLDRINYMHIRHKCSLSTTIHSHTGNIQSTRRKYRRFDKKIVLSKISTFRNHLTGNSISRNDPSMVQWGVKFIHRKFDLSKNRFAENVVISKSEKYF